MTWRPWPGPSLRSKSAGDRPALAAFLSSAQARSICTQRSRRLPPRCRHKHMSKRDVMRIEYHLRAGRKKLELLQSAEVTRISQAAGGTAVRSAAGGGSSGSAAPP